jgi:hypothetical protein
MSYNTSVHAQARMQQRGISARLVRNVIDYGSTYRVLGGAVARRVTRKDLKELDEVLSKKDLLDLDRHRDVYVVISNNDVITVGHRSTRFYD